MNLLRSVANESSEMIGSLTKRDMSSFCLIETGYDNILIGKDGSLGTVIEVNGTNALGSTKDLIRFQDQAQSTLRNFLKEPGHAVQFCFIRNPDGSEDMLNEFIKPMKNVAKVIDLDVNDILDEKAKYVSKFTVVEKTYIVLWTRIAVLGKAEREKDKKDRDPKKHKKGKKGIWNVWPQAFEAQRFDNFTDILLAKHETFVSSFVSSMRRSGISMSTINVRDALTMVRENIYQNRYPTWTPSVPGSLKQVPSNKAASVRKDDTRRMPWARMPTRGDRNDLSHVLWDEIPYQLFDYPAVIDSNDGVVIGKNRYVNIDISKGPVELRTFNNLIMNVRDMNDEPPWRMSFLLEGGGLKGIEVVINDLVAMVTAPLFSTDSKLYGAAIKDLKTYAIDEGVICRIRMSLTTWAPRNNPEKLALRVSYMQRALEGWGGCETKIISGDIVESVLSTVPALDIRSTAPAGLAPLEEAVAVLPWMRENSPWESGSIIFRTRDGRPFPYLAGSSLQTAWVDLVYGPMGKGKSFLLNTLNFGFTLSEGATMGRGGGHIPYLTIIETGSSSSGFINVIRSGLRIDQKHQVIFKRLQMRKSDTVNPFDLPPFLTRPLAQQKELLKNLVTTLTAFDRGGQAPAIYDGMSELASKVIDEAYKNADDTERNTSPKMYSRGENGEVDEAIHRLEIDLEKNKTWYSIARALFRARAYREAKIAMRYGVPRLQDLLITDQDNIAKLYADDKHLRPHFERMIQIAISDYPILSGITELDFSSARILALDLQDVAPKGNVKQTTIMYMMAMHLGTSHFMYHKDDLNFFPEEARPYYRDEIMRLGEVQKRLVLDEYHRTSGVVAIRNQIGWIMREGRKYTLQLLVASQQLNDFGKDMINSATSIWICGVNTDEERRQAHTMFGLSDGAYDSLRNIITGPGRGGAPVLVLFKLKQQDSHEHIIYNTVGPRESWAYSTTQVDAELRNRLADKLGEREARRRLAILYPGGSASETIKATSKALAQESGSDDDEAANGAIDLITNEIIEKRHVGESGIMET